ncbi:SRPBCC family protein [soil metagenome]
MTDTTLTISRVIKAPPALVWGAWADPARLALWWLPAYYLCRVLALDIKPGGAFRTEMREDGADWQPHLDACFLETVPGERLVFTTALHAGWQPADNPFISISAIITLTAHPEGTDYRAVVLHQNPDARAKHEELGFFEGWGRCIGQLAVLAEGRVQ